MKYDFNFIELCINAQINMAKLIDIFVQEWHENDKGKELPEYLGMTQEEYSMWITKPSLIHYIIFKRMGNMFNEKGELK